MPQMAPYNWLILFFIFNLVMIFIISFNHFTYLNLNEIKKFKNFNKITYKWMW